MHLFRALDIPDDINHPAPSRYVPDSSSSWR